MSLAASSSSRWSYGRWSRDFALMGATSCGPAVAGLAALDMLDVPGWAPLATVLGAVSGALVGAALLWLLRWLPERGRVALAFGLTPCLGGWGAAVAALAANQIAPGVVELAAMAGFVAAALQTGWFVPTYAAVARAGLVGWPLALLAGITSPLAGAAGFVTVMVAIGLG